MIGRVLCSPRCWFAAQVAVLAACLAFAGKFSPARVQDTASYEQFPFGSWRAALQDPRTFGYPLFLRGADLLADAHRAVPACQFLLHVVAVLLFWRGLRALIPPTWASMLVASVLLYSNVHLRYVSTLAPDCLASSTSIAAVAGLLIVGVGRGSKWHWAWLTAAVAAAYHLRPAYVFLVPLIPLLGGLLGCLAGRPGIGGRPRWRLVGGLLLVTAVPLMAYSSLRGMAIGRFGLVSFGGNNFAGVMTVFLTPELEPRLPREVRPLATAVLKQRGRSPRKTPRFRTSQLSDIGKSRAVLTR